MAIVCECAAKILRSLRAQGTLGIVVARLAGFYFGRTVDCCAARDYYFKRRGKYIPMITDGGMRIGGEICKAFVDFSTVSFSEFLKGT